MKISQNFTLEELTASATAKRLKINNNPSAKEVENLVLLVENILQPLRDKYGKPIVVTSGYRCEALNRAVGGGVTSQHRKGMAADIRSLSDNRSENKKIFGLIKDLGLPFCQLIDEYDYDWIHVSFDSENIKRQILHTR